MALDKKEESAIKRKLVKFVSPLMEDVHIEEPTELPKTSSVLPQNQAIIDAQSIMLSLGYEDKEIEDALSKVISTVEDCSNPEEILRKALTCLSM